MITRFVASYLENLFKKKKLLINQSSIFILCIKYLQWKKTDKLLSCSKLLIFLWVLPKLDFFSGSVDLRLDCFKHFACYCSYLKTC